MAITELIFPKVKPDKASLDELERDWPTISKRLTHPNPGLLSAYRGWVLTENGRNVREEHREFLLFGELHRNMSPTLIRNLIRPGHAEWEKAEHFHAFIVSEQFKNFAASIRHLVTGPPTLQLFDTNLSPQDAASSSSIEIFRVTVPNAKNAETVLQTWKHISQKAKERYGDKVSVTYGKSQNLEQEVVAGIIGWSELEVRLKSDS